MCNVQHDEISLAVGQGRALITGTSGCLDNVPLYVPCRDSCVQEKDPHTY